MWWLSARDLRKSVTNPGRDHWIVQFSTYKPDEEPTRYTHGVPQVLRMLNSHITNSHELQLIRRLNRDRVPRAPGAEPVDTGEVDALVTQVRCGATQTVRMRTVWVPDQHSEACFASCTLRVAFLGKGADHS